MTSIVIVITLVTLLLTLYALRSSRPSATAHVDGTRSLIDCPHCGDLHGYMIFPGDTLVVCKGCGANVLRTGPSRHPIHIAEPSLQEAMMSGEAAEALGEESIWECAA